MTSPPPLYLSDSKTSAQAVWSLVFGILSITCIWILGSIPAIILGVLAIKNIDQSRGALKGKGLGIAGIVTGSVGVVAGLVSIGIMASMAFPALTLAQGKARAAKQMNDIRQIAVACQIFASENGGQFPNELNELLPDYIETEEILQWKSSPSQSEALPYLYRTGLTDTAAPDEPLIAAPESIQGKRSVGFVSGAVQQMPEEEFLVNHADKF